LKRRTSVPSQAVHERAEREAAWFYGTLGGKVPENGSPATRAAAVQIDAWLAQLSSFQRGVLALRFGEKVWPSDIERELEPVAAIAVRIECAHHPAVGRTEDLERASVARLQEIIRLADRARTRRRRPESDARCDAERTIHRLFIRAARYAHAAMRAFARARGRLPCVVPPREGR
jgi:hypothetical protein